MEFMTKGKDQLCNRLSSHVHHVFSRWRCCPASIPSAAADGPEITPTVGDGSQPQRRHPLFALCWGTRPRCAGIVAV